MISETGKTTLLLLLLLLAAVAGGGVYLYTDLVTPERPAAPAASSRDVIRMPLPPRAVAVSQTAVSSARLPAAVPAAPVSALPLSAAAKPAPPPAAAKVKAQPAPAAAGASAKKPAGRGPAARHASAGAGEKKGSWTVVAGSYLQEGTLASDLVRISKLGLSPAVVPGARKPTTMYRLVVTETGDPAAAAAALLKVKQVTADAFQLPHGKRVTVYAGSYMEESRALSEKKRLAAAGVPATVGRTTLTLPFKRLTVGPFADRSEAEAAAAKLRSAGFKPLVSR